MTTQMIMPMLRAPRFVVVLALASAGVTAEAQTQGSKWWQSERFQQELSLSTDQIARLEAVFQATEPTLRTQKEALESSEHALSLVISDPKSTEQHVVQSVTKVDAARAGLSQTRTLMLFRMRRILTDEQNEKMKAIHERDRARHQPPGREPVSR